jgi:hypothetical protein
MQRAAPVVIVKPPLTSLGPCGLIPGGEDGEDLAGGVALEASDDLGLGQPSAQ